MTNKQYNIKDLDGLYLTNRPINEVTISNYLDELIQDYDYFPKDKNNLTSFLFKNSDYSDDTFIGSNKINSTIQYSEIKKKDSLVKYEGYYSSFYFYFRFYDCSVPSDYPVSTDLLKSLRQLRVRLFMELGNTMIQLKLTNLSVTTDNWSSGGSAYDSFSSDYGAHIVTGATDYYIELGYRDKYAPAGTSGSSGLFEGYKNVDNLYNFRLIASIPDFDQKAIGIKDCKIIVKYYDFNNIERTSKVIPYTVELVTKEPD